MKGKSIRLNVRVAPTKYRRLLAKLKRLKVSLSDWTRARIDEELMEK